MTTSNEPPGDPVTPRNEAADWGRRMWMASAGLGALCVALAAGLVVALVSLHAADGKASTRASALAAAKAYAVDLSSYRYQDLTTDFDRVLDHATPSFKKSYTNSSGGLDTILERYKASATGKVLAAGVSSATSSHAVVLVFVNQTVTNSQDKKPTTDESRIVMTLVRHGGRWLIDKVTLE